MRRIIIGVILLVVVGAVVVVVSGVLPIGDGDATVTGPTPTAEPDPLISEGIVVAAKQAELSFGIGGTVTKVPVELGSLARSGAVLATLDAADAELQVRSAENDVQAHRAALDQLRTGPRSEEIASCKRPWRPPVPSSPSSKPLHQRTNRPHSPNSSPPRSARCPHAGASGGRCGHRRRCPATAQARLAAIEDGPTAADLTIVDAALATAQARLAAIEDGPTAADLTIADAALATAQARLAAIEDGPTAADLTIADAASLPAQARLAAIEEGHAPKTCGAQRLKCAKRRFA